MRGLLVLGLLLLMVSSSLAANRKDLAHEISVHTYRKEQFVQQAQQETDESEKDGQDDQYPGSTVNNHHYIPREDFNKHNGGNGNG